MTMHGRKVGLEVAPGRFHAGEVVVADIGLEPPRDARTGSSRARCSRSSRAKRESDKKYTAGARARRRRLAGDGRRGDADGDRRLPRRRRLRDRLLRRSSRHAARGGEAPARRGARRGREARRARGRARPRPLGREARARPPPARGDRRCRRSSTRTRSSGSSRSSGRRPTVLTPHEGELGRLLGREPAWVAAHRLAAVPEAAERFGCVCLLKGADALVAAPGHGRARRRARPALARDRRHGRRPHRRDRRVPRQGHGGADGRRRRRGRLRRRRAARPVARARRLRRRRAAARSVGMTDVVTGAFSYTGRRIAARLLAEGRDVRTLSRSPAGDGSIPVFAAPVRRPGAVPRRRHLLQHVLDPLRARR